MVMNSLCRKVSERVADSLRWIECLAGWWDIIAWNREQNAEVVDFEWSAIVIQILMMYLAFGIQRGKLPLVCLQVGRVEVTNEDGFCAITSKEVGGCSANA